MADPGKLPKMLVKHAGGRLLSRNADDLVAD
jgi:hypothetical protein